MPPKRRGRGGGRKRGGKGRATARTKKEYSSEEDKELSEPEAECFDKVVLQRSVDFDFEALINDPAFNHPEFVHQIKPEELNLDYFEKTSLDHPLFFRCDPKLLGMTVPNKPFTVNDVLELVGGNRIIEVVEVQNQGSVKMSLQEFVDFYNTPPEERKVLYNVLSLEFSLTPLEDKVKSPQLVRDIDWVGNHWPDALKQRWIAFHGRDKKLYVSHHTFPKVQNYCLMSVANCYTDFHIDFSGTSVWYHVLNGRKVFWLIPPTDTNIMLYQEFLKSVGDSSFFGKSVEKCHVVILEAGDTMLIPSGWIHAVYTPIDSLVFGGNFLHSRSCKMQIRVFQCENRLNITRKFRLPYLEELLFFVIADYVKKWTGREYTRPLRIKDCKFDYVGKNWVAMGGHLKKIEYSQYENGAEITNEMIGIEPTPNDSNELNVIAMHAENAGYDCKVKRRRMNTGDEALDEEDDEDEATNREKDEHAYEQEIDELCSKNPLIFYKNPKHDFVRNKCVPDHKLPVGHEPPISFIDEEINKITPRELEELEALGLYLRKKAKVEISEGICQPASLLNCYMTVLKRRRAHFEDKIFVQDEPRRKYTRRSIVIGDFDEMDKEEIKEEVEEDKEEHESEKKDNAEDTKHITTSEVDEGPETAKEDNAKPENGEEVKPVRRSTRNAANRANAAIKEEYEEQGKSDKDEEEEEEEEKCQIGEHEEPMEAEIEEDHREDEEDDEDEKDFEKNVSKEEKKKMSRKEKKEKREKELERKRKSSTLDAELIAAHGHTRSKKKKPEKPMFVGGLPMVPIMDEPAVPNPYNYDPKMEMVKLGTGQLKSAYRKSKNNIELRLEKKMYKLGSQEEGEKQDNEDKKSAKPKKLEPISIDIFETTPSSSNKKKKEAGRVEKTQSSSPLNPLTPKKSPISSPVVKEKRRSSENLPTARRATYMPSMSRQDRLLADTPPAPKSAGSRLSLSERKPLGLTVSPISTKRPSTETTPYTPTAVPVKSSWMHCVSSDETGECPIDVVNDKSPQSTPVEKADGSLNGDILSPTGKDSVNGNNGLGGKKQKISASTAIGQLKSLVVQLNQLNEVE